MSLNPEIRDRAYQFFIEEALELLQVLEDGLLDLRQDHSTAKVHNLMRAAHSIKGGAANVELKAIETLAHQLEDFFKALYSDRVEIDAELESLLLQGYDCLRNPLIQQVETGAYDEETALLTAEPIFSALQMRLGNTLDDTSSYIPSSTDLGVDVVASIFEVDVLKALEHLTEVLHRADNYDLAAELRSQLELFAGFAELFNLPGFEAIVRTARTALDNHPDRAQEILRLTIADCTVARAAVLEGDRDRGGEVASELLALGEPSSEAGETTTTPNLEDVFGDSMTLDPSEAVVEAKNLDLEEVFAASEAETTENNLESVFETIPEETGFDEAFEEIFQSETAATEPATSVEAVFDVDLELEVIANSNAPVEEFPNPSNIDAALESIDEIYEQLPKIDGDSSWFQPPIASKSLPNQPSESKFTAASARPQAANLSIRVDLNRLDKMNRLVGELTVQRNSLALQNQQLQNSVGELSKKILDFQKVTDKLRETANQMLISQSDRHSQSQSIHLTDAAFSETQFDSLEMDRYSILHSLVQEILEEAVGLENSTEDVALFAHQSDRTIQIQERMLGRMRDELMWARMLPLEQILQRFPRTLRDLSEKYHKPVELKLIGTEILVDRAVLEKLYDPLLHLLRNGFDHGIEAPEVRRQQGKPAVGTIEIHAYYRGDRTIVEVKDDGKGLDLEKIANRGVERGLISPERAKNASKEEICNLIFATGFSTADKVSELSGRGVGMDVVRSQIETLKGTVEVNSTPEKGTVFSLSLPLTLSIAKLLICSLGTTAFAIPSDSITDIIIPDSDRLKVADNQRFLLWDRSLIPVLPLVEMLPYNCTIPSGGLNERVFEKIDAPQDWALPLLILRRGAKFFALEIASIVSERELAIEPLNKAIAAPSYIYGCSILSDGTLIPVFDGQILIDALVGKPQDNLEPIISGVSATESNFNSKSCDGDRERVARPRTIMVVDDSTALRRTMSLSLSERGYHVVRCRDGKHALEQFSQNPDIDLIICDLEMPVMNGFEFLEMRRRNSELAKIPVIMLTSRGGAKHRNLAMQLGANGYSVKPYIEREFFRKIDEILQLRNHNPDESTLPDNSSNKTILIVDDSAALRRTMALSLENSGYKVLQARDGREGLELLKDNPQVNLTICDVEMPNMNGFEFLTERRNNAELLKIPVAMLTSRGGEKHRSLAQQLGANAYFTKPYVEKTFLSEIAQIIKDS